MREATELQRDKSVREKNNERGRTRAWSGQPRRSFAPAERHHGVKRAPGRVPQI